MDKQDANDWLTEFGVLLVTETNKLVDGKLGDRQLQAEKVYRMLVGGFATIMVYKALTRKPSKGEGKMSKKDQLQFAHNNFKTAKRELEEAMGAAFGSAMQTFSGQPVDYYCQVKIVPPAVNKTPC